MPLIHWRFENPKISVRLKRSVSPRYKIRGNPFSYLSPVFRCSAFWEAYETLMYQQFTPAKRTGDQKSKHVLSPGIRFYRSYLFRAGLWPNEFPAIGLYGLVLRRDLNAAHKTDEGSRSPDRLAGSNSRIAVMDGVANSAMSKKNDGSQS